MLGEMTRSKKIIFTHEHWKSVYGGILKPCVKKKIRGKIKKKDNSIMQFN